MTYAYGAVAKIIMLDYKQYILDNFKEISIDLLNEKSRDNLTFSLEVIFQ